MSEAKSIYTTETVVANEDKAITSFRNEWDFLSNFASTPIEIDGVTYPTTEHAFQAMKTYETTERYTVRDAPTPASAKAKGRKVTLREDWGTARFDVMEEVLRVKFSDPVLREKLLATGDRPLIEGNTWRDTTWGAIRDTKNGGWKGRNALGKLLMKIRDELRSETDPKEEPVSEVTDAELAALAVAARTNAYAPYSNYQVGAAIVTGSGKVFTGVNVENASYGLCNCAERTAIFTAATTGERIITTVAVATDDGGSPCGACRQVLSEFVPKDGSPLRVLLVNKDGEIVKETTLAELLPMAFNLNG